MEQQQIPLPLSLEQLIGAARARIAARIEALAESAHAERISMVAAAREHMNRCAGQRRRRHREFVERRTPLPAVFRSNRGK